jgi:23S rRNA pseudouridine1911/1915/1917 synthase
MAESDVEGADEGEVFVVDDRHVGARVDVFVNAVLDWHSRNRIKDLVKLGQITVNGKQVKPSYSVAVGDRVTVVGEAPEGDHLLPEEIPLDVLFEDATMLALNKAPYMPVHPGAGHRTGTMANALAFRFRELSDVGGPLRPGIVHRLDRDTSGVIAVAKTNRAHFAITQQFQDRTTEKIYFALAEGVMEFDEEVADGAIARHPTVLHRMVIHPSGRESFTRFEVVERYETATLVKCFPKTGRTHQIRVHLASLGHPILCDRLYGRRSKITLGEIASLAPGDPRDGVLLDRQALHAHRLTLQHPLRGERMTFEAPLAADIERTVAAMREHKRPGRTTGTKRL